MAQVVLQGRGEYVALYNLKEDLGFDLSNFNIASKKGQEELYEALKERIDSNEIESLSAIMQLRLLYADSINLQINRANFDLDSLKLQNREFNELNEVFTNVDDGDLFYLLRRIGDGEFVFESNTKDIYIEDLEIGYIECSQELENIIYADMVETICDTIDLDSLEANGVTFNEDSSYFDATVIVDALYSARFDKESQSYILTRLEVGSERIIGTDCYIDDFEKN